MPDPTPTPTEPSPAQAAATRAWQRIRTRGQQQPTGTGHELTEALIVEECATEIAAALADLRGELSAEYGVTISELEAALASSQSETADARAQYEAQRAECAALGAELDDLRNESAGLRQQLNAAQASTGAAIEAAVREATESAENMIHALELNLAACTAALNDALAKATQFGRVEGTTVEWEKNLALMPPLAKHEIEGWRRAAIRRLAALGTTQADVMIARLADLLLAPYAPVEPQPKTEPAPPKGTSQQQTTVEAEADGEDVKA